MEASDAQTKETGKTPHFEAALEMLQTAVKKLESGELSLEDSLRQFEEGVRLSRICQEQLRTAEQKVEQLLKVGQDGQPVLQPFTAGRN